MDIDIDGPAGRLEALVEEPPEGSDAMALVCHPHPQHEGTMHNKVAYTLARSFYRLGAVAVRFNFRGVGRSQGAYADGEGETEDALAAGAWMRRRWPASRLYLAGFSFGAGIALRCASQLSPHGLVTVAPPVPRIGPFEPPRCRWLVVQGEADEIVDPQAVRAWAEAVEPRPDLAAFPDTGHFFHGQLGALRQVVTEFFAGEFDAAEQARG